MLKKIKQSLMKAAGKKIKVAKPIKEKKIKVVKEKKAKVAKPIKEKKN